MRRESFQIEGGTPGVRLYPEDASESRPTDFEFAVLVVALRTMLGDIEATDCARSTRVLLRVIDGYGADIQLKIPRFRRPTEDIRAGDMLAAAESLRREKWRSETNVSVPWRKHSIGADLSVDSNGAADIDIYPHDGENIGREQCERLLFEPLDHIVITSD